jgi:type I restriction enzyme S subunit
MGQSPNGAFYTDNPSDIILVQGNADLKDGWVCPRVWTTQITKTANAGDLIMSVRAPVGAVGKTAFDVVLGRGVAGIAGDEFLYQALQKKAQDGYWTVVSAGSTFDSISGSDLKDTPIPVPSSSAERAKIGEQLRKLDSLITLHQREDLPPRCALATILSVKNATIITLERWISPWSSLEAPTSPNSYPKSAAARSRLSLAFAVAARHTC